MAQVVRPEVKIEVLVDDLIFNVEILAIPGRFRLVPGLQSSEVESVWKNYIWLMNVFGEK